MSLNKHLLSAYCLQGDSHFTKGFPVVWLQSESLSMHLNMICFINFNPSVYTHSLGINRFHTVRHFILKRSKRLDLAMFTRGMCRGSTGKQKIWSQLLGLNLGSNSFYYVTLGKLLNLAALPFFSVCKTWTLTFLPHMVLYQALRTVPGTCSRFHIGVTYYY